MKVDEAKSLVDLVRNAKVYELGFISVIVLPIYLGSWGLVLKQFDDDLWEYGNVIFIVLASIYIIAMLLMKYYQSKEDKIYNNALRIRKHILSRGWKRMSFIKIQENIDKDFNADYLSSIIEKYPDDFGRGTVRENREALVLLEEEEEN